MSRERDHHGQRVEARRRLGGRAVEQVGMQPSALRRPGVVEAHEVVGPRVVRMPLPVRIIPKWFVEPYLM